MKARKFNSSNARVASGRYSAAREAAPVEESATRMFGEKNYSIIVDEILTVPVMRCCNCYTKMTKYCRVASNNARIYQRVIFFILPLDKMRSIARLVIRDSYGTTVASLCIQCYIASFFDSVFLCRWVLSGKIEPMNPSAFSGQS